MLNEIELREIRSRLLNETVELYNSTNRAFDQRMKQCVYSPSENSPGCAIGRLLTPELCEELDKAFPSSVGERKVFNRLPEEIQVLGQDFLVKLQQLHDQSDNWNEIGLTQKGSEMMEVIIQGYL